MACSSPLAEVVLQLNSQATSQERQNDGGGSKAVRLATRQTRAGTKLGPAGWMTASSPGSWRASPSCFKSVRTPRMPPCWTACSTRAWPVTFCSTRSPLTAFARGQPPWRGACPRRRAGTTRALRRCDQDRGGHRITTTHPSGRRDHAGGGHRNRWHRHPGHSARTGYDDRPQARHTARKIAYPGQSRSLISGTGPSCSAAEAGTWPKQLRCAAADCRPAGLPSAARTRPRARHCS